MYLIYIYIHVFIPFGACSTQNGVDYLYTSEDSFHMQVCGDPHVLYVISIDKY